MSKERRLGRGLEALLGRAGFDAAPATAAVSGTAAVASAPAFNQPGSGAGAARLILHAPEELEQAAAALPTISSRRQCASSTTRNTSWFASLSSTARTRSACTGAGARAGTGASGEMRSTAPCQ